jgi:tryptophan synthase alpha chain
MNRITEKLQLLRQRDEKALALFLTAGYPTRNATVDLVLALEKAGADIIELGMPFSDPLADGSVIQQASAISLRNGVTLESILEDVRTIRKKSVLPIVLMGYMNPILRYEPGRFFRSAASAGADGIIIPELPLEESGSYSQLIASAGLAHIHLVAPTTSTERIRRIDNVSSGFLYCVSVTGVTGIEGSIVSEEYLRRVKLIARKNPVLVGFGIHSEADVKRCARLADGVIVGSALLRRLTIEPQKETAEWVLSLKNALAAAGDGT